MERLASGPSPLLFSACRTLTFQRFARRNENPAVPPDCRPFVTTNRLAVVVPEPSEGQTPPGLQPSNFFNQKLRERFAGRNHSWVPPSSSHQCGYKFNKPQSTLHRCVCVCVLQAWSVCIFPFVIVRVEVHALAVIVCFFFIAEKHCFFFSLHLLTFSLIHL